ncbi:hypothetical protein PVAP13_6NG014555 [Panicum virgatum]|uniref:Uncharacterized protein n=1 Tax=Panicum virgatum TaxID=38727 RepID=A0A8T0QT64_PANVG|nr:hypothetical protein PVAP13_6NG014555 [Panicum virgatum]
MVQWLQFMGLQHLTASSAAGGIGAGGPPRRRPRTSSSTRTSRPCSPTSGSRMGSLGCWALEYDRSGQATVKSDSVHRRGGARAAHLREEGRRHQQAFDQAERGHPVQMAQQTIEQALALCRKGSNHGHQGFCGTTTQWISPPGISSLKFSRLSLGTIPPKIEGIWIRSFRKVQIKLYVDFRLGGDPNIIPAVKIPVASLPIQVCRLSRNLAKSNAIFNFSHLLQ